MLCLTPHLRQEAPLPQWQRPRRQSPDAPAVAMRHAGKVGGQRGSAVPRLIWGTGVLQEGQDMAWQIALGLVLREKGKSAQQLACRRA